MATSDSPFVRPALFADRNFALATVFIFIIGIILLATLALITPFLQNLLGYPVVTAGLVMGPRGIGTMLAMVLVGRLIGRIETRVLILAGLGLTILALPRMSGATDKVTSMPISIDGILQGAGSERARDGLEGVRSGR